MGLAEDLLNAASDFAPTHTHTVTDPDDYFIIDPDTRVISNAASTRNTIMQYDHNSERYTFELPRYIEGHDMLLCNRVRIHFNNVDGNTNAENADVDEMTDLQINPENEDTVISSWLISRYATQLAGTLNFLVQYLCIDDGGNVVYEWHTDIYTEVDVKPGRNNGEQTVIQYNSILEEWYQRLFGAGDSVMADISALGESQKTMLLNESAAQKEAIELKGAEVLATIPADYTETYRMAEDALRKKANAIILDTEGESIHVADSSDNYLLGMKLYGKTTQVSTTGAQLIPYPYKNTSNANGDVTWTINPDRSVSVSGTVAHQKWYAVALDMTLPAGTYTLSGCPSGGEFNKYWMYVQRKSDMHVWYEYGNGVTFEVTEEGLYDIAANVGYLLETADNVTFYPMLVAGEEVKPFEQYTGGVASPSPDYPQELTSVENPTVDIWGKNLFNMHNSPSSTLAASVTVADKSITVSSTDDAILTRATYKVDYPLNTPLTVSFDATVLKADTTKAGTTVRLRKGVDSQAFTILDLTEVGVKKHYESCVAEGLSEAGYELWLYLRTISDAVGEISVRFENIQIEIGTAATEYSDYVAPQTMAIDHTLSAIPVTANGNYVDSNGQHWICDEVDFERGVYVQRCFTETPAFVFQDGLNRYSATLTHMADSSCAIDQGIPVYSSKLRFDPACGSGAPMVNGIRVAASSPKYAIAHYNGEAIEDVDIMYPLADPIETPLSDEELTKFKMVRTHYHDTTFLNDQGAHMSVKYSADTKLYLKNEAHTILSEVLEAIENGTY